VKYLILIHSNEATRQAWAGMTEQQRLDMARAHRDFGQSLIDSGQLVHSEALDGPESAKWVSRRDDEVLATDGPFAEAKEYLAGFYVVECPTIASAVEYAARLPEAGYSQVEVRPTFDITTLDL
jgi:hypothetical protein